MKISFTEF